MAALARQTIGYGTAITPVAASASDTVAVDERGWVEVIVGGTSTTVTMVVPGSDYGQARPDVSTGAVTNTTRRFGPLVPDLATDGVITFTTSQQTGVTIAWVGI